MEQQRRTRIARTTTVLAAAAALGVLAACGTDEAVTATPSTPTGSAVVRTAGPPSVVVPAGSAIRAARPVPLPLTDAVRAQLVAAYVAENGYRSSWVAGIRPGTAYFAVDRASGVQLARVTFEASPSAPERVLVALQDEGSRTALQRVPGGSWTVYDICSTPGFLALTGGELPAGGHCPTP